ncbi:MAG: GDP-mannose 4,6-dehydratase [Verrucomicrobia bacterium]|nr:GDP-mannose 4,6-dehydratase [Verrucomicrobiota bacterium]
MKKALITGITGQDGSYLAELLLGKGYEVHGIVRRTSSIERARLTHLSQYKDNEPARLILHYGELADSGNLIHILYQVQPDEIYNLAGQSSVRVSFEMPEYTSESNGVAVVRLLEAIVRSGLAGKTRFYQASSSEMFGRVRDLPITEVTPFNPRSPYAAAKVFAHNMAGYYREAFGLHACCGILFNHESPQRGETFVTRKITLAAGRIKHGLQTKLKLGDLSPKRDWGYAPEYVEGMWRMLQADKPDDYVIATNESHSVQEFVQEAFSEVGLDWAQHVEHDQRQVRTMELDEVRGSPEKMRVQLGWEPKVKFHALIRIMMEHDLKLAAADADGGAKS